MSYLSALILLLLVGCASIGPSAEQMKAMEGLSSSLCVKSPGWNGSPVEVHYASFGGKATGTAGGGGKATCGGSVAEFINEGRSSPTTTATVSPATATTTIKVSP